MKIVLHSLERRDDGLIDVVVSFGDSPPKTYSASYDGSRKNRTCGSGFEELFFMLSHQAQERFGNCAVYQKELMGLLGAFDRGEQFSELPAQLGTTTFCTLRPTLFQLARAKLAFLMHRIGVCGLIRTSPYNSNYYIIKPDVPFRSRNVTAACKKAWRKLFQLLSQHDVNCAWGDVALWVPITGESNVVLSPRCSNNDNDEPEWDSPPDVCFFIDGLVGEVTRETMSDISIEFFDWIRSAIMESFHSRTIQNLYKAYNPMGSRFSIFWSPVESGFRQGSLELLWSSASEIDADHISLEFNDRVLTMDQSEPYSDAFSEVMDRYDNDRPEEVVRDLQNLAEKGHVDAAYELAGIHARTGESFHPESAYKWYYIALSQQGYSVEFKDENLDPPYYCGPAGDFRNECMVSELIEKLGFDKIRALDAEAARWLAEQTQSIDRNADGC